MLRHAAQERHMRYAAMLLLLSPCRCCAFVAAIISPLRYDADAAPPIRQRADIAATPWFFIISPPLAIDAAAAGVA